MADKPTLHFGRPARYFCRVGDGNLVGSQSLLKCWRAVGNDNLCASNVVNAHLKLLGSIGVGGSHLRNLRRWLFPIAAAFSLGVPGRRQNPLAFTEMPAVQVHVDDEGWQPSTGKRRLRGKNSRKRPKNPIVAKSDDWADQRSGRNGAGRRRPGNNWVSRTISPEQAQTAAQAMAADPEVKPLAEHGGDRTSEEDGQGSVATLKKGRGAEYLVRRLRRDAPAIAEALGRGEYPSARAAAVAAGIVKAPTTLEKMQRLWGKADNATKEAFLAWTGKTE